MCRPDPDPTQLHCHTEFVTDHMSHDKRLLTARLQEILGEPVIAPVKRLNVNFQHFLFKHYDPSSGKSFEEQVSERLSKYSFVSRWSEHVVWTDICRILFCQAFLDSEDEWVISNPAEIGKCWKIIKTYGIEEAIRQQWRFIQEKRAAAINIPVEVHMRHEILKNLWLKYQRSKPCRHGQSLLTAEDENDICAISPYLVNPIQNKRIIPRAIFNKMRVEMGQEPVDAGTMQGGLSYSHDGKSLIHHFIKAGETKVFLEITKVTLKEGYEQKLNPTSYYCALLNCFSEESVQRLMADLLDDFKHHPKFYAENINNTALNPWRWGMPDIVAHDPQSNYHILLECKKGLDRLSKKQIRWLTRNSEVYGFNVGFVVLSSSQIGKL
jgi:hypothetical protein